MDQLQTASFVKILLAALVLPAAAFVVPPVPVCRGCLLAHDQQHVPFFSATAAAAPSRHRPPSNTLAAAAAAAAAPTLSGRRPRSGASRLRLRRDELPEESLRELEAGERYVKELEEEYWKSLDADEIAVERKCASGLACLKMGMLERAAEDYTEAAELGYVFMRVRVLGEGGGDRDVGGGEWLIRALAGLLFCVCVPIHYPQAVKLASCIWSSWAYLSS